jgi:hypothetical protein
VTGERFNDQLDEQDIPPLSPAPIPALAVSGAAGVKAVERKFLLS